MRRSRFSEEQVLDVAQREGEPNVHHHGNADDFWRRFEIAERTGRSARLSLPALRLKPVSSDNANGEKATGGDQERRNWG